MIAFIYPFVLFTLLPLTLWLLYLIFTNKSKIERVFDKEVLKNLQANGGGLGIKARNYLLGVAIVLIIFALARPVWLTEFKQYRQNHNVMIAIDSSQSMFSKDVYPDRFGFAKKKVVELLYDSQNVNYALVVFDAKSYLVSPFSANYGVLVQKLENLQITPRQTQANYINLFEKTKRFFDEKATQTLVILTDGHNQSYEDEMSYIKNNDINVIIVGVGTTQGAPMVDANGVADLKQWSRLNEEVFGLSSQPKINLQNDTDLSGVIKTLIRSDATFEARGYENYDKIELFKPLLWIALIAVVLASFSIPRFKGAVFVLFLVMPYESKALSIDYFNAKEATKAYESQAYERALEHFLALKPSPQKDYNIANTYYKMQKYDKALEFYANIISSDATINFKKYHNSANSYFMMQEYEKAVQNYEKALRIREDAQTKENLAIAREKLKQENEQKKEESKQIPTPQKQETQSEQNAQSFDVENEKSAEKEPLKQEYRKYERMLQKPATQLILLGE
jgi:Ca-activated chloride channel family protein